VIPKIGVKASPFIDRERVVWKTTLRSEIPVESGKLSTSFWGDHMRRTDGDYLYYREHEGGDVKEMRLLRSQDDVNFVQDELTKLVRREGQTEGQDDEAATALSWLLTQSLGNGMRDALMLHGTLNGQDEDILPSAFDSFRDVLVERDGSDVVITLGIRAPLRALMIQNELISLKPSDDPRDNEESMSLKLRVSIGELERAGREKRMPELQLETTPERRIRILGFQGESLAFDF
jgi:hypothetical protein